MQKQVWGFAKELAEALAAQHSRLLTAQYRVSIFPSKHMLVDYNQNAWGRIGPRRARFAGHPRIRLSPATKSADKARRRFSTATRVDGVIAKRLDRPCKSGGHGGAVQKIKGTRTADSPVGGFRYAAR